MQDNACIVVRFVALWRRITCERAFTVVLDDTIRSINVRSKADGVASLI